ncbi:MAG: Uncharacterized MFS-type transporter, partial [uncultured Blastococcus sp.]
AAQPYRGPPAPRGDRRRRPEPAPGRGRRGARARGAARRHRAVLRPGRPAHHAAGPLLRRVRPGRAPAGTADRPGDGGRPLPDPAGRGHRAPAAVARCPALCRQRAGGGGDRPGERAAPGLRQARVPASGRGDGALLRGAERRCGRGRRPDHPAGRGAGRGLALGARGMARARARRVGSLAAGGRHRARAPDHRAAAGGLLVAAAPAAGPAGHRLSGAAERAVLLARRLAAHPARRRRDPGGPGRVPARAGQPRRSRRRVAGPGPGRADAHPASAGPRRGAGLPRRARRAARGPRRRHAGVGGRVRPGPGQWVRPRAHADRAAQPDPAHRGPAGRGGPVPGLPAGGDRPPRARRAARRHRRLGVAGRTHARAAGADDLGRLGSRARRRPDGGRRRAPGRCSNSVSGSGPARRRRPPGV